MWLWVTRHSDHFSHDTMSVSIKIAMDQGTLVLARYCAKQFLYISTLGPNRSLAKQVQAFSQRGCATYKVESANDAEVGIAHLLQLCLENSTAPSPNHST